MGHSGASKDDPKIQPVGGEVSGGRSVRKHCYGNKGERTLLYVIIFISLL